MVCAHQLIRVEDWIQDQRRGVIVAQLTEQRPAKRAFARAHLSRDLHESLSLTDAVKHVIQGFTVLPAIIKKPRIRRNAERRLG